jgi:hypothetical protein
VQTRREHPSRENFSAGQFGEWSGKFCRDYKGKFCQPDREFESLLVRQVPCFSREISLSEIIAEVLARPPIGRPYTARLYRGLIRLKGLVLEPSRHRLGRQQTLKGPVRGRGFSRCAAEPRLLTGWRVGSLVRVRDLHDNLLASAPIVQAN